MKKLLVLFLTALLLVGCSNSGGGKKATCTMDMSQDGMEGSMEVVFKADKDVVTALTMNISLDLSAYDKSMQEMMKPMIDAELLSNFSGDGVKSKSDLKDGFYTLTIDITDMKNASNLFGGNTEDFTNAKLEDVVKEAENSGATCK